MNITNVYSAPDAYYVTLSDAYKLAYNLLICSLGGGPLIHISWTPLYKNYLDPSYQKMLLGPPHAYCLLLLIHISWSL